MKTVKMSDTIYDLVSTEAKLQDVLVSLGFAPMAQSVTLNTVGRVMTLDKAVNHINLDVDVLKEAFLAAGVIIHE